MDIKDMRRSTYIVNSVIILIVVGLGLFFLYSKAYFLVWFSIPVLLVYILGFVLVAKDQLEAYVSIVYFCIFLYMCVCTVCLGFTFGFHLYCLSMIPIIFHIEYLATKINARKVNAFVVSCIILLGYLAVTVYCAFNKPIYELDEEIGWGFYLINSLIVIAFLFFYSRMVLKLSMEYENKLRSAALVDQLTGLFNRHYMITELEKADGENKSCFLAMVDIDDFKKINDTYGHSAGDFVLTNVARIMREVCKGSKIARWGGEEFLILSLGTIEGGGYELIDMVRARIEAEASCYGNDQIKVTITCGVADHASGRSIEQWVGEADGKLYIGKGSGKNKVVK
ncbi:MAG: GGDEF domain-containing protein [Saccharofermentans sp.]|nr:GGDEF domain-containing protein [Saccharofermentans sp.]